MSPIKKLLMTDKGEVRPEVQNRFLYDLCQRYFTIPFPPSLPETFNFKASYTIRFQVLPKDTVGIPKKILDYYFSTTSTRNSRYFFACHWRYWEAAYAQILISTLHRWSFQAQTELEKKKDPKASNKIYWPPQGLIDYHLTNFVIRIFSCLDNLVCWLNAVYDLKCNPRMIYFYKGKIKKNLELEQPALHAMLETESESWIEYLREYRNQITHREFGVLFPVETEQKSAAKGVLMVVPPSQFGLDLTQLLNAPVDEWRNSITFTQEYLESLRVFLMKVFAHVAKTCDQF